MLLQELKREMYEPIQTWLCELDPQFPLPGGYQAPASSPADPSTKPFCPAKGPASDVVDIPVMCLVYELPPDGLPIHHSWLSNLKGIVARGYENWRELLEIKLTKESLSPGDRLELASVKAVEGLGRVAIILFSILYTYLRLRDTWSEACRDDFVRLGQLHWRHKCVVLNFGFCAFLKMRVRGGTSCCGDSRIIPRPLPADNMGVAKYHEHEGPAENVVFRIIWEGVPIIWGGSAIIWERT